MPGQMASSGYAAPDVEAACAICGAQGLPECPHEGQRLQLALDQALDRWIGLQEIRDWVLNHARNQVIHTFQQLKARRIELHHAYLRTLPCYSLYHQYHGNPPMHPVQLQSLQHAIAIANQNFKQGIDADWQRSCMCYPDVLDYFFSVVRIQFPSEKDPEVRQPRFGVPLDGTRKVKARRASATMEEIDRIVKKKGGSSKGRGRTSRGRTPPPAPMPMGWSR